MPRIHLKPPQAKRSAKPLPSFETVTLRCPWPECRHQFTVSEAEAPKVRLCPNCIQPLKKKGQGRGPRTGGDLAAVGSFLSPELLRKIKGPTPIQARLIEAAAEEQGQGFPVYLHSVFCQTSLPYRDPGDACREWERANGNARLKIIAGDAMSPETAEFVQLGLPFGTKAHTVLMHINQLALLSQSPAVEMQDSLTRFVKNVLQLDPKGRNMRMVKEQLARLSASSMRVGMVQDGHAVTVNSQIVTAFDVWFPKDERQRVLWPSVIQLSHEYFESLQAHAVPLDETHIAALSHSAMALDIYAWLAQRLHRIPVGKPARVSWPALHGQFGQGWDRLDNFRRVFRVALREVLTVYKEARIEEDERGKPTRFKAGGQMVIREPALGGLTLHNSPPPVPRRFLPVSGKTY